MQILLFNQLCLFYDHCHWGRYISIVHCPWSLVLHTWKTVMKYYRVCKLLFLGPFRSVLICLVSCFLCCSSVLCPPLLPLAADLLLLLLAPQPGAWYSGSNSSGFLFTAPRLYSVKSGEQNFVVIFNNSQRGSSLPLLVCNVCTELYWRWAFGWVTIQIVSRCLLQNVTVHRCQNY